MRLQQLCGAATAKSVEDCLFYRDRPTGVAQRGRRRPEPVRRSSAAEFHQRAADRARRWPSAMTTLSTHDTKRGEDVRARIGVLSQVPSLWAEFVGGWERTRGVPRPRDRIVPVAEHLRRVAGRRHRDARLRERLHAYAEKAIREAAVAHVVERPRRALRVRGAPLARHRHRRAGRRASSPSWSRDSTPHARNDGLAQKLLQLTGPGVPDVYQGTELWEDSSSTPTTGGPVDYARSAGSRCTRSRPPQDAGHRGGAAAAASSA